ncbi:LuxR C-terminal-related transcriptional regulator [Streptomyces sp. 891-h]|uniref:LuxR C-terminal-related transcriptional regulator n=1 Tax=Streptomyces sp. 891-h TaxID=2720714 RepID=UPI001FA94708|nr:LuxR C-terminal-related transcriptional regulator [Streptomyces sp. 891-h]UNZ18190.1 hypothetical protein HC362_15195 [Streptomyces sp. 891-h]
MTVTATPVAKVTLGPREQQVLERLADGDTLALVARELRIRESTASGYLKVAKHKLHGTNETAAAVAVGYAIEAISRPPLLDPETLFLPREQRDIVPLVAQGMAAWQMAAELGRPINDVRADGRRLLVSLRAHNRAHLISRAWQFQVLTAGQVMAWLS